MDLFTGAIAGGCVGLHNIVAMALGIAAGILPLAARVETEPTTSSKRTATATPSNAPPFIDGMAPAPPGTNAKTGSSSGTAIRLPQKKWDYPFAGPGGEVLSSDTTLEHYALGSVHLHPQQNRRCSFR